MQFHQWFYRLNFCGPSRREGAGTQAKDPLSFCACPSGVGRGAKGASDAARHSVRTAACYPLRTTPYPTNTEGRSTMPLPNRQGLYDPAFEHDACGLGFVATLDG